MDTSGLGENIHRRRRNAATRFDPGRNRLENKRWDDIKFEDEGIDGVLGFNTASVYS
jgi:hypothetical protein